MNRGGEFFSAWEGWLEKVENAGLGTPTLLEGSFRLPTAGWLRRLARVAMVQTTDLGKGNDLAASGRFHGPGIRRVLRESKVRPGSVVVAEIAS